MKYTKSLSKKFLINMIKKKLKCIYHIIDDTYIYVLYQAK